ncbi:MAG TPA: GNAT family N-acetyltransferase [Verrucomicrobiae bacterium]|nr:GNAT family N-acetyltransferase [Verrucomicrobiae bacterium]
MAHLKIDRGASTAFIDLIAEYETSLPEDLRHGSLEPFAVAFTASVDEQPCGCVALDERDSATGIIKRLYVRPAFRQHGVARALIDELVAAARERGYARVVLDTDRERLAAAYKFYLLYGFTECAPYVEAVSYVCPTFMELPL